VEHVFSAAHGERVKVCLAPRQRQGRDPASGLHVRGRRARYAYLPHRTEDAAEVRTIRASRLFASGVIRETGPAAVPAVPAVSMAALSAALAQLAALSAADIADVPAGFRATVRSEA